jgi:hypothetical protein
MRSRGRPDAPGRFSVLAPTSIDRHAHSDQGVSRGTRVPATRRSRLDQPRTDKDWHNRRAAISVNRRFQCPIGFRSLMQC